METKLSSKILEKVRETATKNQLFSTLSDPLVLMVSGGADSTAMARLVFLLLEEQTKNRCEDSRARQRPTILHINHQLRGKDADDDEKFVVSLAKELGFGIAVRRANIRQVASTGRESLEQAGRNKRYFFANELLDNLCKKQGRSPGDGRIMTAHTANDNSETFIMRTIVGGGLAALCAIPYKNERVIRPLLDCKREELREWLLEQGFDWREDYSNADIKFLRSFIRHEIIPKYKEKNPSIDDTLETTIEVLREENNLITQICDKKYQEYVHVDKIPPQPVATISCGLFAEHKAVVRRVILRACTEVVDKNTRITFNNINKIADAGNLTGFATDIVGDVTVRNVCGTLVVRKKKAEEKPKSLKSVNAQENR
jgi:tRNA(Ile)-lysidine synthase